MKEICSKWSKFSEQDVAAIKGKADLVSQVVTKYGLPQTQAQSEVDARAVRSARFPRLPPFWGGLGRCLHQW